MNMNGDKSDDNQKESGSQGKDTTNCADPLTPDASKNGTTERVPEAKENDVSLERAKELVQSSAELREEIELLNQLIERATQRASDIEAGATEIRYGAAELRRAMSLFREEIAAGREGGGKSGEGKKD